MWNNTTILLKGSCNIIIIIIIILIIIIIIIILIIIIIIMVINTFKYNAFAPMGRFQLELIYLYFPPSSHIIYVCFCPVGLSLL